MPVPKCCLPSYLYRYPHLWNIVCYPRRRHLIMCNIYILPNLKFPVFTAVKPFITPFGFEENNFAGGAVQVNCFVSQGDSPLKIHWSFHGATLSTHLGMSTSRIGERTSLLTIDSLMAAHSGNYTCTAENAAGSTSYTTNLVVSG